MLVKPKLPHVLLAVSAIILAVLGGKSYFSPVYFGQPLADQDWLIVHFYYGRVRVFWLQSENAAVRVRQAGRTPELQISVKGAGERWKSCGGGTWHSSAGGGATEPFRDAMASDVLQGRIRIGSHWQVGPVGGAWRAPLGLQPTSPTWQARNQRSSIRPTVVFSYMRLPIWVPVVGLLASPVMVVLRGPVRMRRRRRRGLCIQCGYDTRRLPLPRCPECGRPIESVCAIQEEAQA